MSTGLECEFLEFVPGEWFYLLEDWSAPKSSWDWREFSTAYGPFRTYEEACEHLRANHSNPGGHSVSPYTDQFAPDAIVRKLIKEARK